MNARLSMDNLVRYAVAYVFITSGFMLFTNPELGTFFMNLPIPFPHYVMYLVASLEIICGLLLLFNKHVKHASIPLLVIMIFALILTKVPTLHYGFAKFAFDARLDIVMLVLLVFLYNRHK